MNVDMMDDELNSKFNAWADGFKDLSGFLTQKKVNLKRSQRKEIFSLNSKVFCKTAVQNIRQVSRSQNRNERKTGKESELKKEHAVKSNEILNLAPVNQHSHEQTHEDLMNAVNQRNMKKYQNDSVRKKVDSVKSKNSDLTQVKSGHTVSKDQSSNNPSALLDKKIAAFLQSRFQHFKRKRRRESQKYKTKSEIGSKRRLDKMVSSKKIKYPEKICQDLYPKDSRTLLVGANMSDVLLSHSQSFATKTQRESVKYMTDRKGHPAERKSPSKKDIPNILKVQDVRLNEAMEKIDLLFKKLQKSETTILQRDQLIQDLKRDLDKSIDDNRNITCANENLTKKVDSQAKIIETLEAEKMTKLNVEEHGQKISDLNEIISKLTSEKQKLMEAQECGLSMLERQKSETESLVEEKIRLQSEMQDLREMFVQGKNMNMVHSETQTTPSSPTSRSHSEDTSRFLKIMQEKAKLSLQNNRSKPSFNSFRENILHCVELVDQIKCEVRR